MNQKLLDDINSIKFIHKTMIKKGLYILGLICLSISCNKNAKDLVYHTKPYEKGGQSINSDFIANLELYKKYTTYCEIKQDSFRGDFFELMMNDVSITNGQKKAFAYHSSYCFSNKQFLEMKSYLQSNLDGADEYSHALVPIYGLDSILDFNNLPPINELFNEISESLIGRLHISSQNKEYLRLYAILVNLGRIGENVYLEGILNIFSKYFEKYPAYIDDFYRLVLANSLERDSSINCVYL